jgi:hypothetical protein
MKNGAEHMQIFDEEKERHRFPVAATRERALLQDAWVA